VKTKVAAAGLEPATKALSEPATCPWVSLPRGIFFYFTGRYNTRTLRECAWRTKTYELDKNRFKV